MVKCCQEARWRGRPALFLSPVKARRSAQDQLNYDFVENGVYQRQFPDPLLPSAQCLEATEERCDKCKAAVKVWAQSARTTCKQLEAGALRSSCRPEPATFRSSMAPKTPECPRQKKQRAFFRFARNCARGGREPVWGARAHGTRLSRDRTRTRPKTVTRFEMARRLRDRLVDAASASIAARTMIPFPTRRATARDPSRAFRCAAAGAGERS
jgi:hypothetical protein